VKLIIIDWSNFYIPSPRPGEFSQGLISNLIGGSHHHLKLLFKSFTKYENGSSFDPRKLYELDLGP
jgi:hypothetical protein